MQDAPDMYFTSISLSANFIYELIKLGTFSVTINTAGVLNRTKGLIGTDGMVDFPIENPSSRYETDYHLGLNAGAGFRYQFPNGKTAINFIPFSFTLFTQEHAELCAKIEMDFGL